MLGKSFFSVVAVVLLQSVCLAGDSSAYVSVSQIDQAFVKRVTSLEENGTTPFVLSLPNGTVVNEGGVLTQEGFVLGDTRTYTVNTKKFSDRICAAVRDEKHLFFEGRLAVVSSPGGENWYHWLLQILPRLIILSESQVAYDRIYLNNVVHPWQINSLELVLSFLRIPKEKMLVVNGNSVVRASILVVPSVPFIPSRGVFLPEWMRRSLRAIFLSEESSTEAFQVSEKIYISRSKASIRRIINEEEYVPELEALGFKVVHLETISSSFQAALFNGARIIIAPHGSGLSNLLFSRSGCKVIEIDRDDERRGCFKLLTKSIGGFFFPCMRNR